MFKEWRRARKEGLTNRHSRVGFSKVLEAHVLVVFVDGCRNSEDKEGGADELAKERLSERVEFHFAVQFVPMPTGINSATDGDANKDIWYDWMELMAAM